MVSVLFANVFNAKVIHSKEKYDVSGGMDP